MSLMMVVLTFCVRRLPSDPEEYLHDIALSLTALPW